MNRAGWGAGANWGWGKRIRRKGQAVGGLSPIYLSVAHRGCDWVVCSRGRALAVLPKDQTTAIRSPGPCVPFRRFRSPCTPHVFCGDARSAAEQAPTPPMPALLFATQPLRLDQLPASAFGPNPPALRKFSVASTRSYDCCREHAASPNPRPAVSSVDPRTCPAPACLTGPIKKPTADVGHTSCPRCLFGRLSSPHHRTMVSAEHASSYPLPFFTYKHLRSTLVSPRPPRPTESLFRGSRAPRATP